jgi:hypothetical protein
VEKALFGVILWGVFSKVVLGVWKTGEGCPRGFRSGWVVVRGPYQVLHAGENPSHGGLVRG